MTTMVWVQYMYILNVWTEGIITFYVAHILLYMYIQISKILMVDCKCSIFDEYPALYQLASI